MKKSIFLLAAAAAVLASCTSDELTDVNPGRPIGFRTSVNGATRAQSITGENFTEFSVTAIAKDQNQTSSTYFDNVQFTASGGTFVSEKKYYWPASALDFFAYSPTNSGDITRTDHKTFTVKAADDADKQVDLVFAHKPNQTRNDAEANNGVSLNFRHTGAKIAVKVKNTNANLKFQVKNWRVGFVDKEATFTYNGADTNGKNSGQLDYGYWSENSDAKAENIYTYGGKATITGKREDAVVLGNSMILIPQKVSAANKYQSNTVGALVNGSYIGLEVVISNYGDGVNAEIYSGWAIWPVDIDWAPGKSYTYTIDLAGGGYYEKNFNAETGLDPILEGIKFVSVTVDDWTSGSNPVTDKPLSGPTE